MYVFHIFTLNEVTFIHKLFKCCLEVRVLKEKNITLYLRIFIYLGIWFILHILYTKIKQFLPIVTMELYYQIIGALTMCFNASNRKEKTNLYFYNTNLGISWKYRKRNFNCRKGLPNGHRFKVGTKSYNLKTRTVVKNSVQRRINIKLLTPQINC